MKTAIMKTIIKRYHYTKVNPNRTPRKCICQKSATRERLTETNHGIDKSSRVFRCDGCE